MRNWLNRTALALVALLTLSATGCDGRSLGLIGEAHAAGLLAFPVPINVKSDRVHWAGDSVITGYDNNNAGNGIGSPVFWQIASTQAARRGAPSGAGNAVQPAQIHWTQDGVSGTGMAEVAANVTTRVLAYAPTVLFLMGSSNEWGTTQVAWETAANIVVNAAKGQTGGCKVVVISNMFGDGEQWTTASGWGLNFRDAAVASLNVIIKNWATARGDVWYMNLRGDAITDAHTYLKLVSELNVPEPGSAAKPSPAGIVGPDGFHPLRADGQKKLATEIYSYLQVTY